MGDFDFNDISEMAINDLDKHFPTKKDDWISVHDMMPPVAEDVLCFGPDESFVCKTKYRIFVGYSGYNRWWMTDKFESVNEVVYYWKPLPKRPEEFV